ncbi:MAG: cyclic nucleotide-binding domain-containing protein [Elusimicrobia bacterium]|nr:cyclic nucleotide-binding domain-containing protein [Elusimicrobiota bacterium]
MLYEDKIKLLRSLNVLKQMPERQLAGLAEFLRLKEVADGGAVFEEGSTGMSLYFVASGRIRISKRIGEGASADLAVLGPGEYFGEMALVEEVPRSASAVAVGKSVLFELFRGDLSRWVKANAPQAVQFFADLLQVQSQRLRKASNELALRSELEDLIHGSKEEPGATAGKALDRLLGRLESAWSGAVYLAKEPGAAPSLAVERGAWRSGESASKLAAPERTAAGWLDDSTFHAPLVWRGSAVGHFLLHADASVKKDDREKAAVVIAMAARMAAAALAVN